jgi:hypothetical protein
LHPERRLDTARGGQIAADLDGILTRQGVEQREMRRDDVSVRREVLPAQAIEIGEALAIEGERQNERWRCLAQN